MAAIVAIGARLTRETRAQLARKTRRLSLQTTPASLWEAGRKHAHFAAAAPAAHRFHRRSIVFRSSTRLRAAWKRRSSRPLSWPWAP